MRKLIILWMLLTAPAWAWEFTIQDAGSANVTDDAYIHAPSPTMNYCGSSTMMIGSAYGVRKGWVAFWTLSDSLALAAYTGTVDSLKLTLTYSGAAGEFTSPDSMSIKARACRRVPINCELTWNEYSTGNSWTTAGAGNTTSDVYDPYETDGVHADSCIVAASDASGTKLILWLDPDHVAAENWFIMSSWIKDGTARIYCRTRDYSVSSWRPKLTVYGSAGAGQSVGVKFGANVSIGENVKVSK